MKLFAIGNYDYVWPYALVMAESKKDAINKMKALKPGDTINTNWTLDDVDINEYDTIKDIIESNDIREIKSGIYIAEN